MARGSIRPSCLQSVGGLVSESANDVCYKSLGKYSNKTPEQKLRIVACAFCFDLKKLGYSNRWFDFSLTPLDLRKQLVSDKTRNKQQIAFR